MNNINLLDTSSLINLATSTNLPNILTNLKQPLVKSIDIPEYTIPNYSSHIYYAPYQDINSDSELRKKMISFFYKKIIKKIEYYTDLYKYIIQTKDNIRLIKNINEYENNDRTFSNAKMNFLINNFITYDNIKKIIKKFITKNNINWYDLKKYKSSVYDYIHTNIRKYIKHALN
jgi:hypothetical protein